jgi:hypothetical protein
VTYTGHQTPDRRGPTRATSRETNMENRSSPVEGRAVQSIDRPTAADRASPAPHSEPIPILTHEFPLPRYSDGHPTQTPMRDLRAVTEKEQIPSPSTTRESLDPRRLKHVKTFSSTSLSAMPRTRIHRTVTAIREQRENREPVSSLARFLSDEWPPLTPARPEIPTNYHLVQSDGRKLGMCCAF